jgi:alkylation response protein AidB-like acyl-CoA dehydrogenase
LTKPNDEGNQGSADAVGLPIPGETEVRYADESAILTAARQVAETILGPNAQESDRAPGPNPINFRALADAGLLGLALPREYGGLDASGATQREYTEILASYCGVTTFTQAQHHGPSRMIANGPNETLKRRLLPDLASGRRMCAVSFAHLRRPGPPVLRADPVAGGYRLTGTAPWVTGWGLMDQVVFGATLPDGRFVYAWSPGSREDFPDLFADAGPENGDWGTLRASAPIPLCAMNASATVELTCENWFIPEAHKLSESDRETMRRNDRNGVLGATTMPIGCATGSVRLLCETAERRSLAPIRRAAESFVAELGELREQIAYWNARVQEPEFFENAARVRAWGIELAVRVAHAAVTAGSGAANLLTHPAQRLLREAMFYTIQAQTQEVMDATLARLERPA